MYRDKSGLYLPERYAPQAVVPGVFMAPRRTKIVSGGYTGPISYVASNEVSGTTAFVAGGALNDVIIGIAVRGNATQPTIASGFNALLAPTNTNISARIGWKYHDGSESSSYTWANAGRIIYLLYRGCNQTNPIGDADSSTSNTTSYPIPAKTLVGGSGSWVVWGGAQDAASGNGGVLSTPSGLTFRIDSNAGLSFRSRHGDTNGIVTSFSSTTGAAAGSGRAVGWSIELLVA